MKLLIAVESVASAELLAAVVAARPWATDTRARVLTVIDYTLLPAGLVNETGGRMQLIRPEMERRAKEVTSRTVKSLARSGIEAEADVRMGDPRVVVPDAAAEWGADLIFVRSHVYTDITRWMLGSVAREVVRRAPCSVEIVRAGGATDGAGMKILLATDGSEYSRAAARSVSERLWPAGTEVKVISVADPFVHTIEYTGTVELVWAEQETEGAKAAVREAVESVSGTGLEAAGEVVSGLTKKEIVDRAEQWGADLVVVGSHGRRNLKRLLLGSVSEFVANHAHCSVEVIRRAV